MLLNWNSAPELHRDREEVCYEGHTRYTVQRDSSGTWLHAEADGQNPALFHPLPMNVHGATL